MSGNNSSVEGVAITSICAEGIRVLGSYNEVEANSVSRVSLDVTIPNHGFTGIFLGAPGGYNRVLNNEVVGAAPTPSRRALSGSVFVGEPGFPSNNNLIQGNNAWGTPGREYSSPLALWPIRFVTTKLWERAPPTTTSLTPMLSPRTHMITISAKSL